MPYLIDGHNLIPRLGLRLDSADDEMELVAILQEFTRGRRRTVEVYFDGAPPGFAGSRKLGSIEAHFIRIGQTADSAMRARLQKMGPAAKNWTVVSSDREVQAAARAARAESITSEQFARMLQQSHQTEPLQEQLKTLSEEEITEWMGLFSRRKKGEGS
ncbi:MAG: NYN domain-containing protein [Chloroflexi bacterium]|nr:NYN domain-containing protein [Chloroflexota bacterium]